jgi:prophage tail gpP-like protein
MVAKVGHLLGQWHYYRDRRAGRNTRLIEYKSAAWPVTPTSPQTSAAIPAARS